MTTRVLFVCLGNICRSPIAEAAMRRAAAAAGLDVEVDSAGTGDWNLGNAPDERARVVAAREGLDLDRMRARLVTAADFAAFDHVLALDHARLADLAAMRPQGARATLSLLLDHVPGREGQAVADPYYGDAADFDAMWRDVSAGVEGLVAELQAVSNPPLNPPL